MELLGQYDRAAETYQKSLDLHIRLNDPLRIAQSEAFLGNVAWARGDYPNALKLLEGALSRYKKSGDLPGQAWVMDLLGNLHLARENHQEAEKLHRAAYAMALETGDNPEGRAWNDFHLATIELVRGHEEEAQAGFLNALEIFDSLGDVLGEVATCTHLGEIAWLQKDFSAAEKYILKSLRLVIPTGCKPLLADAMINLAYLLVGRGQHKNALGILMLVLSHPTCRQQTKDRMVNLATNLKANFSEKEIEGGFSWAKNYTIEEIASTWVETLSAKKTSEDSGAVGRKTALKTKKRKKSRS